MKKTIRILVGIPCSGKSTYCKNLDKSKGFIKIVSRDIVREEFYDPKQENFNNFGRYMFNYKDEDIITKKYNKQLEYSLRYNTLSILDNTHSKEKYIDEIICKYQDKANIEIKFFDINIIKAHYRNVIRRFKTGKWIPIKVMNNMYKNYKKINREKYKQYIIE